MSLKRVSIAKAMALVAVLGFGIGAVVHYQRNSSYYAAGWWEAERELWQGNATIYSGGYRLPFGDFCNFDQDTGLPFRPIYGCVMEEGDLERERGHNDHIAQYVRWHGLPRNTLKPWEKELFDLKHWFDGQSQIDPPTRLLAGGETVVSPNGTNSVRPVSVLKDDGTPSDALKVIVTAKKVIIDDCYARFFKGESELLWGPKGAPFFVIHSTTEFGDEFQAIDLRTGRPLRQECWREGRHVDDL